MDKCYPLGQPGSVAAGVWCVANAVVGFSGNLLTLTAIHLARRNNKLGCTTYSCSCFDSIAMGDL